MGGVPATESERFRTCPACRTVVRPTQASTRRHRGVLVCWVLAIGLGMAVLWWNATGADADGSWDAAVGNPFLQAALPALVLVAVARLFPRVRVIRCPTCKCEQTAPLGRPAFRRWWPT